jgi:hypothetical protein
MGKFRSGFRRTCKAVSLKGKLPDFISKEILGYCQDLEHGLTLELDKIRPDTQVIIANLLKDSLDEPMLTLDLQRRSEHIGSNARMGFGVPVLGAGKTLAVPIGWLKLGGRATGDVAIWATNLDSPSKLKVTGVTLRVTVYRW